MDLMTLMAHFQSDDKCRAYLERLRWPTGVTCLRCQSEKISRIYARRQFHCDTCTYQFSVTAGTISGYVKSRSHGCSVLNREVHDDDRSDQYQCTN
jgi:hypothetical protein